MMKIKIYYWPLILLAILSACNESDEEEISTPPADVSGLVAIPHDASVTLSWHKPTDNNIKEYSLSYVPEGVPRSISASENSVTISSLKNGLAYTFTLKTRNQQGELSPGVSIVVSPMSIAEEQAGAKVFFGDVLLESQNAVNLFDTSFTAIDGNLIITGVNISDISRLHNLDSVTGKIEVYFNEALTTLEGLHHIRYAGNTVYIRGNNLVSDLDGLRGLIHLGKDIVILDMPLITHLNGLSQLRQVPSDIFIGIEAWKEEPKDRGNKMLSDYCGLKNLLVQGDFGGILYAQGNAADYTVQEIKESCKE